MLQKSYQKFPQYRVILNNYLVLQTVISISIDKIKR